MNPETLFHSQNSQSPIHNLPVRINLIGRTSYWHLISGIGELLVNQLSVLFDLKIVFSFNVYFLNGSDGQCQSSACGDWLAQWKSLSYCLLRFTFDSRPIYRFIKLGVFSYLRCESEALLLIHGHVMSCGCDSKCIVFYLLWWFKVESSLFIRFSLMVNGFKIHLIGELCLCLKVHLYINVLRGVSSNVFGLPIL